MSGSYGILNRILNLDYDPELLFIDFVLHRCHEGLASIVEQYITGKAIIPMPDLNLILDMIADELEHLADALKNNKSYITHLKRIVEISYTTTGNGAYLYRKGLIKI